MGKLKILGYSLFCFLFVWISVQLFFDEQTKNFFASVKENSVTQISDNLTIVYPNEPLSLEPTLFDPVTRDRLQNIYEPLVKPDRDLNMKPALALSWGMIDDVTWEFKLREGVKFHDGSTFDFKDVKASFDRAMKNSKSELKNLLSSIKEISKIDNYTLRIKTKNPDPLLLQKISTVLIVPVEKNQNENSLPGTGPYKISLWKHGERMVFDANFEYWGDMPKFKHVSAFVVPDKSARVKMLSDGKADLLSFVPFDAVKYLNDNDFKISTIPSLEVQFLLFNFNSKNLNTVEKRKSLSLAIDHKKLIEAVGGYAKPVSQFVSNGVFGFNPEIENHKFDIEKAKKGVSETGLKERTVMVNLPLGLDVLGESLRGNFKEIGVLPVISYLDNEKLMQSYLSGDADIYFLGFKADLGDSSDFLGSIVKGDAEFNIANYKNKNIDNLIEKSSKNMDIAARLKDLQGIMKILVEDDMLGVPLFEYELLYSFPRNIKFEPRIDGFIYFDDIIKSS